MREFAKIAIAEKLDHHEYLGMEKIAGLVEKSLLDISNIIMEQDKAIIATMKPHEVEIYMNVEIYFMLNDYIYWIDEEYADDHTGVNCPVCARKHRAAYLIESLLRRWTVAGKKKLFSDAVHFRAYAMEKDRVLN